MDSLNKIYFTLFVSTIIIVLASFVINGTDKGLYNNNLDVDQFWIMKAKNNNHYNMVVIGDSRTYRGVAPKFMNELMPNVKIMNFGFSSGCLDELMFSSAEKLLDKQSNQKYMLIGVTPGSLTTTGAGNYQLRQELNRPYSAYLERIYLYPYLGLFDRVDLGQLVTDIKKNNKQGVNYSSTYYADGWVASNKNPQDTTEALAAYKVEFNKRKTDPQAINTLISETNKWVKQGIKVFAFRPPTTKAMLDLENELSQFDEQSFVKRFEQAGGHWIDVDRAQYHSYDGSHIDSASAVKLSKFLANEIKHAGY